MEWMILPLKRYAEFSGRSRRKEYWMWILFLILANIVLSILDAVLGLGGSATTTTSSAPGAMGAAGNLSGGLLSGVFSLAVLVPNITVAVRRLHDTDRSGWWILLPIVPLVLAFGGVFAGAAAASVSSMMFAGVAFLGVFISGLLLLVWYCTEGTRGPNRFGDDPKADLPADLARTFE
ncbi:DUF805 domain-containing protein [Sphingomonas sp. HMP6]|uniref:DUF805 domain-containing protein n=1 Tax=Sphingomonas sp. HMP6 TaxID=1517551 RepID=UPI00159657DE|nr:DUF805 domain-containing protein [Sphingomonas sp. HMP6]BCA58848.1 hypothetical protein HMP06_1617 [Sphingomonas sp. HMP6]